ncbi:hypothetical protein V6N12_065709 [Hibiscus sabdariffa]|uniref:Uncharacterized protein n=1 Tax=Hibiscus sabdariffa TaxID=183260 RepID=A0ABR2G9H5_9ROSI
MAYGHQFKSVIGGIAKHMAMFNDIDLLRTLTEMTMDTLSDIEALLLDINQHLHDLTKDYHHVGLGAGFTSDLAVGILNQASVEYHIEDLIIELVEMSLINRLQGK